jgi:hypothetical protein
MLVYQRVIGIQPISAKNIQVDMQESQTSGPWAVFRLSNLEVVGWDKQLVSLLVLPPSKIRILIAWNEAP